MTSDHMDKKYTVKSEICIEAYLSIDLPFKITITILRRVLYRSPLKAHTDRTRFGNWTRISDFQCRLALIFFHFSQTFGNILAI